MKLKNTEQTSIKKRKKGKYVAFVAGISISTLTLLFIEEQRMNTHQETTINSEFNHYSGIYKNVLLQMDDTQFDKKFIDIYKNGNFLYKGKEYDIDSLYATKAKDGNNYIVEAGEDYDFFTKKKIDPIKPIALKKTTLFWNAYQDNVFHKKEIVPEDHLLDSYLQEWDGLKHQKVPERLAEDLTRKEYQESLTERQNQKR